MKHVAEMLAVTAFLVFARILRVVEGQTLRQFLVTPANHIQLPLGSCVNLTWTYRLGENDSIVGVSFGVWSFPGYVSKKLLVIKPNGLPLIRPTYEKKVHWVGDFGNSTASLQMCNVTIGEAVDYGVHIELGLDKNPMTDTVQLNIIGARKQFQFDEQILTVLEGETLENTGLQQEMRPIPTLAMERKFLRSDRGGTCHDSQGNESIHVVHLRQMGRRVTFDGQVLLNNHSYSSLEFLVNLGVNGSKRVMTINGTTTLPAVRDTMKQASMEKSNVSLKVNPEHGKVAYHVSMNVTSAFQLDRMFSVKINLVGLWDNYIINIYCITLDVHTTSAAMTSPEVSTRPQTASVSYEDATETTPGTTNGSNSTWLSGLSLLWSALLLILTMLVATGTADL